jgi:hypothetical protein
MQGDFFHRSCFLAVDVWGLCALSWKQAEGFRRSHAPSDFRSPFVPAGGAFDGVAYRGVFLCISRRLWLRVSVETADCLASGNMEIETAST